MSPEFKQETKIARFKKLEISLLLIAEMSCEGNLIENKYTKSIVNIADKHQELVTGFISQKILHPHLLHFNPGVKLNDSTDCKGQKYRYQFKKL